MVYLIKVINNNNHDLKLKPVLFIILWLSCEHVFRKAMEVKDESDISVSTDYPK